MPPAYEHTQKSPLHLLIWCTGVVIAVIGVMADDTFGALVCCLVATLVVPIALMFMKMTVRDEGEYLAVRYGPLPVFKAKFAYTEISHVEEGRSTILDGWGIHYLPGRGWTYNLWGYRCVKMIVRGKTVRIGSDEATQLAAFLKAKTGG